MGTELSLVAKSLQRSAKFLVLVALLQFQSYAQTFNVIHAFTGGSDGGTPLSGFTTDAAGNMYGTTSSGGSAGGGTIFKLNKKFQKTVLHNFAGGTDGATPEASPLLDASGNLYGTTLAGGTSGAGTVYKVGHGGKETILYSFAGGVDGSAPIAGLAMDAAGNLYGTTTTGGANGTGTVFKLAVPAKKDGKWKEKILYSFGPATDGATPIAGVTLDAKGRLYGTTSAGGSAGYGTVYRLANSKTGWKETILHNFLLQSDGATPYSGLIFDKSGNLYGAATQGGDGSGGGGTVFQLTQSNGNWTFTVLYGLAGWDISGPFRNLLLDKSGNIFGTTHCDGTNSDGTVFELKRSNGTWTYSELYLFTGGNDGLYLFSNLVFDAHGNLYGTASEGGAGSQGVIFQVQP